MNGPSKRPCRKEKQDEPEKECRVKLNDLPELPFELILSYLSLKDLIRARAVSRRWYKKIDNFRPKCLCYSGHAIGFVHQKNNWISGTFAENFIGSPGFGEFLQTFGQSILSSLKRLRLTEFKLYAEELPAFAKSLESLRSFDQLEDLVLFQISCYPPFNRASIELSLKLPMLKSFHLDNVWAFKQLTLDAPKLQTVKLLSAPEVRFVHGESVEKLICNEMYKMERNWAIKLKNLKYLCWAEHPNFTSRLLVALEQLKELHLNDNFHAWFFFKLKQAAGRENLKIFFCGCLMNGPSDPGIESLSYNDERYLVTLAENRSRLTEDGIQLCNKGLYYKTIDAVVPGPERIELLNKFTDLHGGTRRFEFSL